MFHGAAILGWRLRLPCYVAPLLSPLYSQSDAKVSIARFRIPMSANQTENLLFETSPFGTIDAIVEHDGRVVYFYLNERPENSAQPQPAHPQGKFGMRACWVRNLQRGPIVLNKADMTQGMAPMMPRNDCIDSDLHSLPNSSSLSIVWFEEGNGAALLEIDDETKHQSTIAIIPPWSGIDGFFGYASNCAHESPLAWPMPENKSLQLRIDQAAEFWNSFTADSSPFVNLQHELISAYDVGFGADNQKQYYAIDGGKFPPRGLIRYETESETIVLTVGMSLCPMPSVELSVENPSDLRRIEIGTKVPHGESGIDEALVESAIRSISSYAAYPWRNHSWLGPEHTIDWSTTQSKATLVKNDSVRVPTFRNDPINLLWINT